MGSCKRNLSRLSLLAGINGKMRLSIFSYRLRIFRVPPFKPISRYNATPMIGNISIRIIHGIFMDEVCSDAYKPITKIMPKSLVIILAISAYSFSLVIMETINITSSKIHTAQKHNRLIPFFVLAFPSNVFFCIIIPSHKFLTNALITKCIVH